MIQTFKFRPKGTLWLGCEFEIDFDCTKLPEFAFSDAKLRLTRAPALGFIVSHEYVVSGAHIVSAETAEATQEGCGQAKRYRFLLQIRISDKIGLGFNMGSGTGTFGWTLDSEPCTHHFVTGIICCDGEPPSDVRASGPAGPEEWGPSLGKGDRARPAPADPADRVGALGALFGAAALPATYFQADSPILKENLILFGAMALGLSVAVAAMRLAKSLLRRRAPDSSRP